VLTRNPLPWLLLGFGMRCAIAADPSPALAERGELAVALWPLPSSTKIGNFDVTVRAPSDPELSALGGSGGPMVELQIAGESGIAFKPATIQAIWLFARAIDDQPPEFSVWSKTGVSSYVQCHLAPKLERYCFAWCQDFEVDAAEIRPIGTLRNQPECD
jgi:hypothetical protein